MREPKPFFRKQNRHEQVAKQKYHALLAGRQPVTDGTTVYAVLFQILGWNKRHRKGSTHEFYKRHFSTYLRRSLRPWPADTLRPPP